MPTFRNRLTWGHNYLNKKHNTKCVNSPSKERNFRLLCLWPNTSLETQKTFQCHILWRYKSSSHFKPDFKACVWDDCHSNTKSTASFKTATYNLLYISMASVFRWWIRRSQLNIKMILRSPLKLYKNFQLRSQIMFIVTYTLNVD